MAPDHCAEEVSRWQKDVPLTRRSTVARTGRSLDWRRTAVSPNTGTSPAVGATHAPPLPRRSGPGLNYLSGAQTPCLPIPPEPRPIAPAVIDATGISRVWEWDAMRVKIPLFSVSGGSSSWHESPSRTVSTRYRTGSTSWCSPHGARATSRTDGRRSSRGENDKPTVIALREIAEGKIDLDYLNVQEAIPVDMLGKPERTPITPTPTKPLPPCSWKTRTTTRRTKRRARSAKVMRVTRTWTWTRIGRAGGSTAPRQRRVALAPGA